MPSLHVPPSQRKFPLDFMWLVGASRWRSLIYLLSCRWWNTHDLKSVQNPFHQQDPASRLPANTRLSFSFFHYSLHFYDGACGLLLSPIHPAQERLWITWYSLRNIRSIMSLWPYNNINNLRVYPKHVSLSCRSSLIHFSTGAPHSRSSVNGQSTRLPFQLYCRYYQSGSARLSLCIPLTIFHSATREPRPWHSPGRWLAGRLESLSSSPKSHVADACLQTSVKSHGNGRRFYRKLPPFDAATRCRAEILFFNSYEKNEINIFIYKDTGSAYHSITIQDT